MALKATPILAILSGGWTSIGIISVTVFLKKEEMELLFYNVAFFFVLVVFLFIPFLFLVVGWENIKFGSSDAFSRDYWKNFPSIFIRLFCWFLGVSFSGIIYQLLLFAWK